jgi:hypothetical protein
MIYYTINIIVLYVMLITTWFMVHLIRDDFVGLIHTSIKNTKKIELLVDENTIMKKEMNSIQKILESVKTDIEINILNSDENPIGVITEQMKNVIEKLTEKISSLKNK